MLNVKMTTLWFLGGYLLDYVLAGSCDLQRLNLSLLWGELVWLAGEDTAVPRAY